MITITTRTLKVRTKVELRINLSWKIIVELSQLPEIGSVTIFWCHDQDVLYAAWCKRISDSNILGLEMLIFSTSYVIAQKL